MCLIQVKTIYENSELELHQLETCVENSDFLNVKVFRSVLKVINIFICVMLNAGHQLLKRKVFYMFILHV